MAVSFTGAHVPTELMLTGVRGSGAYPLRTRHVEARMEEGGVHVDHATLYRWVLTYSPQREEACQRRTRPVWGRGRLDETSRLGQGR